jgi:hypothetical protein
MAESNKPIQVDPSMLHLYVEALGSIAWQDEVSFSIDVRHPEVETKQRLAAAIRACCEAIAHEQGLAVSTRSRVMACPAAWTRRAPVCTHAVSSVLWG